ncbi:MAG: hypothetical protein KGM42_05965 [Hyphomicrobiales bacterium]|nr:hypothetical protein [Hyphomicrobiales bacterium]
MSPARLRRLARRKATGSRLARKLSAQNCEATLDVWPQMTHDLQANGMTRPESAEALQRIRAAIAHYAENAAHSSFEPCARTEMKSVRRT